HAAFRIDAMPLTPRRPSATPRRSGGRAGPSRRRVPLKVDLALQGGGAHGAFTWGVLARLLEEEWLQVEGISGTSAGAMNAAVLVDGHVRGGREGARAALAGFWRAVADGARLSPFRRGPPDVLLGRWALARLLGGEWRRGEGIPGPSAGAMNAGVLADGRVRGGRAGARAALAGFWRAVADGARLSPFRRGPLDVLLGRWSLDGSPLSAG